MPKSLETNRLEHKIFQGGGEASQPVLLCKQYCRGEAKRLKDFRRADAVHSVFKSLSGGERS